MDRDLLTFLNEYGYAFLAKLLHERGRSWATGVMRKAIKKGK
jgi:hypothetical protein